MRSCDRTHACATVCSGPRQQRRASRVTPTTRQGQALRAGYSLRQQQRRRRRRRMTDLSPPVGESTTWRATGGKQPLDRAATASPQPEGRNCPAAAAAAVADDDDAAGPRRGGSAAAALFWTWLGRAQSMMTRSRRTTGTASRREAATTQGKREGREGVRGEREREREKQRAELSTPYPTMSSSGGAVVCPCVSLFHTCVSQSVSQSVWLAFDELWLLGRTDSSMHSPETRRGPLPTQAGRRRRSDRRRRRHRPWMWRRRGSRTAARIASSSTPRQHYLQPYLLQCSTPYRLLLLQATTAAPAP